MWTYLGKRVREGRVFTDNTGRKYPPQWWYRTTDAEKTALGLVHVADPAPYDNRFYWDANTPKALDDVNEVDEDNNPVLDADGQQVVTKGLKTNAIELVKRQAGDKLAATDWYVIREAETTVVMPDSVATYRAAVRNASGDIEAAITAASDLAAFMALYDVPVDADGNPTGNAPINNWPDEA